MTPPTHDRPDEHDERALDAFLRGEEPLSQALRDLPQPQPPEALTQRIMADAQRALGAPAANDPPPPGANSAPRPGWFRRLRVPLAAVASLLVAVLIGQQWLTTPDDETVMLAGTATEATAAPEAALPPPDAAAPAMPSPPAADAPAAPARRTAPPAERAVRDRTVLAQQAPPPDLSSGNVIMRGLPPPEPGAAVPATPDNATPQAWLDAIERLLAEERPAEARRAWQQFRAAHPQFPVPEPLVRRLDALQP